MTVQLNAHDPSRAETIFPDGKPPLTTQQAMVEANRCLYCADAPCIQACPTSINIPEFIHRIATGNTEGAAHTIFSSNILGTSCARVCPVEVLCVGDCVYNTMGVPPIQIGKLQRYATDQAIEKNTRFFQAGPTTGKKVALIGGGPASLACAHDLRRQGHTCTIFEKHSTLGGLNVTGVAPYKMQSQDAMNEVNWILDIGGIEVKTNTQVGKDISLTELEAQYDAIFFGAGLGADSRLNVAGEDLPGVVGAVKFIAHMKSASLCLDDIQHCVVVGGGNTAIDAVRAAKGLGIPRVTLMYRGDEQGMSGYAHEWAAAKKEGITAQWRRIPIGFDSEGAPNSTGAPTVRRILVQKLDEKKQPLIGQTEYVEADLVLVAIGQHKLGDLLSGLSGIQIEKGVIKADDKGATGRPKWFVGGDAKNGGKEVVNAAAEGKAAAHGIHQFIMGVS